MRTEKDCSCVVSWAWAGVCQSRSFASSMREMMEFNETLVGRAERKEQVVLKQSSSSVDSDLNVCFIEVFN
jgi:hypothetical protein